MDLERRQTTRSAPLRVRQMDFALSAPFAADWLGGDSFRSQLFNALSMSFPLGEQYFMDSVRAGLSALPPAALAQWKNAARSFIGQEAVHRHVHGQFNRQLAGLGLQDHWSVRIARRTRQTQHHSTRQKLAVTAAYEHFTAVLALALLTHPDWLNGAPDNLRRMWEWHSLEELEHRAVAFDMAQALGVGWGQRSLCFVITAVTLCFETSLQTAANLHQQGRLFKLRTVAQGLRFLFGPGGVVWAVARPSLRYLWPGFHPTQGALPAQFQVQLQGMQGMQAQPSPPSAR
jgi:uncharacterized protein